MARILGSLVARDEENRYLDRVLDWHADFLDGVHVFDDRSDDDTVSLATAHGAWVDVRSDDDASFLEHEGHFRQAGWEAFELTMQPLPGDWVLSIDADEFFCASGSAERVALEHLITFAQAQDCNSVRLRVDEIFHINDAGVPMRRVDGFWGDITAPRLFRYQPAGRFANRRMACGSTPTYVRPADAGTFGHRILHYGYTDAGDRAVKWRRYTMHKGHNPQHVASILESPALAAVGVDRWPGHA